ncbi:M81 family metallopeptidase [Rubinisphaera italica]|uniref:Microcystinase C n=1 Tax=Rubinisphaera italica TaxID=2527969 RepID=A0A5C5XDS4_9PLAN|nr:M81 family metallopeptidase [Rubinisphaera italica]TWT60541.1 hypothetical protein Pan54_12550 [Rubinisphaera italica]
MRIGIASIALEANTFNPIPTVLESFQSGMLLCGDEIWQLRDSHHELGGFLSGLSGQGVDIVPLLAAGAAPGGILSASTFSELRSRLHAQLDQSPPLDAMLLAPHGAMVSEDALDADGLWLQEIRDRMGASMPIIATIDPHANLSPLMVSATDAIISYKTNPHMDQRQRGIEAAKLITRAVKGEVKLSQAACFPPIAIEIERQFSSEGAYAELLAHAQHMQETPGVLSSSIVLGFPYADVPELGSSTIVVTDGNVLSAQPLANSLGEALWQRRHNLKSRLLSMTDAVQQAHEFPGTTCLLDMGDNVGGGSPGDCTILFEIIQQQHAGPALGVIIDPASAEQAKSAGVGAILNLQIGGKLPGTVGKPIEGKFEVMAVSDGRFTEEEPRHGGQQSFNQGTSVVVQNEELTLVLITNRVPPFSLRQITHLGVDPSKYGIIIAKGVHAPVAAYASISDHFIRVNTPGMTAADMSKFVYIHRRHPLFPLELF